MFKFSGIFLILLLCYNIVYAQDMTAAQDKKANKSDIVGMWKMNYQMVNQQAADKSLFFADFQIFDFSDDGFFRNISSYSDMSVKEIQNQFKAMPKTVKYSFVEPGILELKMSEKAADTIIISVITKDMKSAVRLKAPIMKKGDLIFSYLDVNKQLYLQRFLTRLKLVDRP
jgi:hypothetical protein